MREVIRGEHGEVLGAMCTDVPLTDQDRAHFVEVAAAGRRLMEAEDPDGLLGDKQLRALDRLHRRVTPECGAVHGDLVCTRPAVHRRYGTRHVTGCGTQRWQA